MLLSVAIKRLGPWAVLEYLVNPALALLTTPLIIKYLGLAAFGSWVVIITAVSFSVSLASGVSVALGRYIAANATAWPNLVRRAQLDALHVMVGASMLAAFLAIALLHFSDSAGINSGNFGLPLLFIVGVIVVIDCVDTTFAGILRGELRYAPSARAELVARIVQFGMMLLALFTVPSFLGLAVAICAGSLARLVLRYRLCDLSWMQAGLFLQHRLQRDSPLLATVGWATVQNLGNALYTSIDRFIISAAFGATTLALYATASQLTNQIQAVLGAGFSVLSNATAARGATTGQQELIRKCLQISVVVAFGALATYGLFYAAAEPLFAVWVGSATSEQLMPLVAAVAIAAAVQTISVPAHFFLLGIGRFKLVAVVGLMAGILSIALLWLAANWLAPEYALIARASYGLCLFSYFFVLARALHQGNTSKP
jgi:O-antigen/teichoic acid export membrane protein